MESDDLMGMYDTIDGITVYCPKCGELVEGNWQTKSLECCLNHYKPGDKVQTEKSWIEVCAFCQNCNPSGFPSDAYLVSVCLFVVDGVLTGELG